MRRGWWASHSWIAAVFGTMFIVALAWALSNPPSAAPDEPSHYVRVVALSHGEVFGRHVPDQYFFDVKIPMGHKLRHLQTEAGYFQIPGSARPANFCNRFRPALPWRCPVPPVIAGDTAAISLHASTPFGSYLLPALFSRAGHSFSMKMYLARLAYAVQNSLLVVAACAAIRTIRRLGPLDVALLALTFTPLLAFQTGTVAPNGTETLALIAAMAWLIAAIRRPSPRRAWAFALLSVFACSTRNASFLLLAVSIALVMFGIPHVRREVGRIPIGLRRSTAVVVALAIMSGGAWYVHSSGELGRLRLTPAHLGHEVVNLWHLLLHSVSLVGNLDVSLDPWTSILWWVSFAALVAFKVWSDRRQWLVVGAAVIAWCSLNLMFSITSESFGYGAQARYTLFVPAVLAVILATSDGGLERWPRVGRLVQRVGLVVVAVAVAATHLATMVVNAHRHARGRGTALTFRHAVWTPRLGWPITLGVCAVAAVCWCSLIVVAGWTSVGSAEGVGE